MKVNKNPNICRGLSKREFYGDEFYRRRQQEYDEARHFLKNCGKPKSEEDIFWIKFYKDTEALSAKFLD